MLATRVCEVFATPEFQEYAKKNLVLVEADFPRRKSLPADLVHWEALSSVTVPTLGLVEFDDPNPPAARAFYRALRR